ncbi:MAG TPA: hypothetical protein VK815_17905 [Candidatus Acidoferrales bacterium]|jgi:hypothetical protein|nr:hypothetical protein [Candidatus Acidoferrales bacterium]
MDSYPSTVPGGPREEQSYSLVLISGLVTTSLTLAGIYLIDRSGADFHIMGWYANYILPVGAILVGLAASSGYGFASWYSGIKITRRLLWIMLTLQLVAYFGAQYIEFQGRHLIHLKDMTPVGFWEYFDHAARGMAWKKDNGEAGEPLGAWGYGVRLLEILGFVGGSLIVPLALHKAPYCESCQRYMRTRQLAPVPASVPIKKVKKSDAAATAAYQAEQESAFATGKQTVDSIQALAVGDKAGDFQKLMADLGLTKKQTAKLPGRFTLAVVHCRRCFGGSLVVKHLLGQGNNIKQTEVSRAELHPEFVRSICQ